MALSDFAEFLEHYHRGVAAFVGGDPELQKTQWSRRDDVTLANPLGPPVRGWDQVEAALDRAAAQLRTHPSAVRGVESISRVVTADLAYTVEIERDRMELGSGEHASVALRVTTVFRREAGIWRIVHRHADTVTTPRSIESLVDR